MRENFDQSGYRAVDPIPDDQVKVGTRVLVPHWHEGEITGYDVTTINVVQTDPLYVLCANGQAYFAYSLVLSEVLHLQLTVPIHVDGLEYANSYGLLPHDVLDDARNHLSEMFTEVLRAQADRIGAGVTVGDTTITTNTESDNASE